MIRASKGLSSDAARQIAQKICARSIARTIPMSLLKRKSCSEMASTIFEAHLHRAKVTCPIFICAICRAASLDRPFDTLIL